MIFEVLLNYQGHEYASRDSIRHYIMHTTIDTWMQTQHVEIFETLSNSCQLFSDNQDDSVTSNHTTQSMIT